MGKKILIVTGSPNREGNSSKMAGAFARGAEQAGHIVTKFETAFHNMRGFTAAAEPDDFAKLTPLLNDADVVAIATPLYWFSFPAQLKAVIDQLDYSENSRMTNKDSYLFVSGGETDEGTYEPIQALYRSITEFVNWRDGGILKIGGADDKGAVEKSGVLEKAEAMGRNA